MSLLESTPDTFAWLDFADARDVSFYDRNTPETGELRVQPYFQMRISRNQRSIEVNKRIMTHSWLHECNP